MFSINTNLQSQTAQQALSLSSSQAHRAMERLATGKRVNSASDDAAGLAIASRMTSQIEGAKMGMRNLTYATSALQTADAGMSGMEVMLQRLKVLSVQAASDIYTATERAYLQLEADMLMDEIQQIATGTKFNHQPLLTGTFTDKEINLGSRDNKLSISINDVGTEALGFTSMVSSLGDTGTITDSAKSGRVRVASGPNGMYSVTWEYDFISSGNWPYNAYVRQFDAQNNPIGNGFALHNDGLYKGDSPSVTILANGSTVVASNDIPANPWDAELKIKVIDASGNVVNDISLPHTGGADGISAGRFDRPSVVDLGNSQFMVTYTPTNIGVTSSNGGAGRIFDYSGNAVGGELSLASDNTTSDVWIEKPTLLSNGNLAVPMLDRTSGTSTDLAIRVYDWANQSVVTDIAIDSVAGLTDTGYSTFSGTNNATPASLQVISANDRLGVFWLNADDGKLYGQVFDLAGNPLTDKKELAADADYLSVVGSTSNGSTSFNLLYGENATGTEQTVFQRFDTSLTASLDTPTTVFSGISAQAQLMVLADGTLRAYESYDPASAISYQDFTVSEVAARPSLNTNAEANSSMSMIDTALARLTSARTLLGAQLNRVDAAMNSLSTIEESTTVAKSRIIDADFAIETAKLAQAQVLEQSATALISQANSQPEFILRLLDETLSTPSP